MCGKGVDSGFGVWVELVYFIQCWRHFSYCLKKKMSHSKLQN